MNTLYNNQYYTNSNPNGNFTQNTYAPHYNQFPQAYMPQPSAPLIEKINTQNPNNTLHNNLKKDILKEEIKDYIIELDSRYRDFETYPNPYKYTVLINQNIKMTAYQTDKNGNLIKTIKNNYNTIIKDFKNVKYIHINYVILPYYLDVQRTEYIIDNTDNKIYTLQDAQNYILSSSNIQHKYYYEKDPNTAVLSYKYVLLKLIDHYDNTIYTNSYEIDRKYTSLIRDKVNGQYFIIMKGKKNIFEFKDSALGNIKQINIEFLDDEGNPLGSNYNMFINDMNKNNIITNIYDDNNNLINTYDSTTMNNMNINNEAHPLNKMNQNFISLTFGVYENELNTNISYH